MYGSCCEATDARNWCVVVVVVVVGGAGEDEVQFGPDGGVEEPWSRRGGGVGVCVKWSVMTSSCIRA